jgi:hypothetical protein
MWFIVPVVLCGAFGVAAAALQERGRRREALALLVAALISVFLPFLIIAGPP